VLAGRYELVEVLASGGTAVVYTAVDRTTGGSVAVKVLYETAREVVGAFFGQEGRLAARVQSPHLVHARQFGEEDGRLFIVFDLVAGVALPDMYFQELMPWRELCAVVLQVLAGLDALHQGGIVHRDVKPDNIIVKRTLGDEVHVTLLDLGFAWVPPSPQPDGRPGADAPGVWDRRLHRAGAARRRAAGAAQRPLFGRRADVHDVDGAARAGPEPGAGADGDAAAAGLRAGPAAERRRHRHAGAQRRGGQVSERGGDGGGDPRGAERGGRGLARVGKAGLAGRRGAHDAAGDARSINLEGDNIFRHGSAEHGPCGGARACGCEHIENGSALSGGTDLEVVGGRSGPAGGRGRG
jgi:hypothetical protein